MYKSTALVQALMIKSEFDDTVENLENYHLVVPKNLSKLKGVLTTKQTAKTVSKRINSLNIEDHHKGSLHRLAETFYKTVKETA
jgi:fructose-bisphosphate aldolase class 1